MNKRAVGIVVRDNKILLIRRFRGEDGWIKGWYFVFPGGGVEENETPEDGCVREMKEELSVDVEIDRLLFVMHNPAKVHNFNGRDEYFYLIKEFSGDVELGGPEKERMNENDQFQLEWVPLPEIKTMDTLYPKEAKDRIIEILDDEY